MGIGPRNELSVATYQLAEQYRVGQALALYNMHSQLVRFCKVIKYIMLGAGICIAFFCFVVVAIFLYQYLTLLNQHYIHLPGDISLEGQIADLQERFILGLPGIVVGLVGCIGCLIIRGIIARMIPTSLLVCTDGLLEIRPKKVDVTYWNEVREMLQVSGLEKKKRYALSRINRKPLLFGEAFEDIGGLVDLVRQQTQKDING